MEQKEKDSQKLWFKAKRYGYGWYPSTWQGWFVMFVYIALLLYMFRNIDVVQHSGSDTLINFAPRVIVLTIVLLIVCYLKGEKPGWRWGGEE